MFIDEIKTKLHIKDSDLSLPKITACGKGLIFVEGHCGLLYFSREEIRLGIKGGAVGVFGENLIIAEVSDSECVLRGRITRIEYV